MLATSDVKFNAGVPPLHIPSALGEVICGFGSTKSVTICGAPEQPVPVDAVGITLKVTVPCTPEVLLMEEAPAKVAD